MLNSFNFIVSSTSTCGEKSVFNLPGKKDLTKNKGTNNNLLAIDDTENPIERIDLVQN
ncbi:hypothetical protein [Spiroplasma endosymbiont of Zeiraphera isertana]|uniref:hypothetical protein n=1 Tax=Spiroplasma endosymbiont of Zeiraphera isertana TaxID=3066313 RepID=UPI00313B8560